jgi:DNA-binding Xre family transcriptional regulator
MPGSPAARMDNPTRDRLCRFFKVQPGDLFDYIPGGDGPDVE